MSFNRLSYDNGLYTKELKQSMGPGIYRLQEPEISCKQCYPYPPSVRLQHQGVSIDRSQSLIDIDSELLGLPRKFSKDPVKKYVPLCPSNMCKSGEVCGQDIAGVCDKSKKGQRHNDNTLHHLKDCFIPEESTRISNPSCNLRGTGINRWEWLCQNPQDRVEIPFDYNISNRMVVKDNHRPCLPTPIDNTLSLPKCQLKNVSNNTVLHCVSKTTEVCSVPDSSEIDRISWNACNIQNRY